MAKIDIRKIKKIEKQTNKVHEEVEVTFTTFIQDGKKYFQIDTYGSINRDRTATISQSFQADEESVHALVSLLKQEFGENK